MRETSRKTYVSPTSLEEAESTGEKRDLVARLSVTSALLALMLVLGEVCGLLAVSLGYHPPAAWVYPAQHIVPPARGGDGSGSGRFASARHLASGGTPARL